MTLREDGMVLYRLITHGVTVLVFSSLLCAQQPPREQWGAPAIRVSSADGRWVIAGQKNQVTLNASDLALRVQAGPARWEMAPSSAKDMLVKSRGEEFYLRLADAQEVKITPYDTGFKAGVKIRLGRWRHNGLRHKGVELDLALFLTLCLEGKDEELVFDVAANEREAVVRQLDWPTALDARTVDHTVLSNGRGNLLPRNWPKVYSPIRAITKEGTLA